MPATPLPLIERRRLAHLSLAAALSLTGVAAIVLYRFPPGLHTFYPVCPIFEYLHLQCPGCGTTRALSALLHGHMADAVRLNALFILLVLPVALVYGLLSYMRAVRDGVFCWPQPPMHAMYAGIGVILAFMVLRNL